MAKKDYFLHDIRIKARSAAYGEALVSPWLGFLLDTEAMKLKIAYQARVGVKSGKLRASANVHNGAMGGKNRDRRVGKLTVANKSVVAPEPYKGAPFYYGVFHEEGNKGKGRSKKRKYGTDGYHELREVAHEMRGGK